MIFFCDIDGVLIPGRAYYMPGQTWPLVSKFDPCVVGMVNRLCRDLGGKVVIHSNWRGTEGRRVERGMQGLAEHFVQQGIQREYMHKDALCPTQMGGRDRWADILLWLQAHPEVGPEDFWVLEDTQPPADWPHVRRVVQTDFDEGLTVQQYLDIHARSRPGTAGLILPPGHEYV